MGGAYAIRPATAGDSDFLTAMLVAAVNWSGRHPVGRRELLADPHLARYVVGWQRASDLGVVAEADGERIGAAWLRFFDAMQPGYGFVDADVPELAMAVLRPWRGRGVGRALLREITRTAARHGIRRVSLSVQNDNPAARLYVNDGFRTVSRRDGASTMVKRLVP